jgi:hypothetical protein
MVAPVRRCAMVHATESWSDAVGIKPRRFADRPRITIRVLMCLVLIVALSNGLCMTLARQLHAPGLPTEVIRRQEMALFLFLNANALVMSLYAFYAPWWNGKSRREWLKDYLTRRVPFFIVFAGVQLLIRTQKADAALTALIFIILFVCGPVLLALGLSVELPRMLRVWRSRSAHRPDVLDPEAPGAAIRCPFFPPDSDRHRG